mgnify:CR=1 FL=1
MATQMDLFERYAPDYAQKCVGCGATPVVTAVSLGELLWDFEMCGPCTFGEADCVDPESWNKECE